MGLFSSETIVSPKIVGITDGTTAAVGVVGEHRISRVPVGSAVPLTTATPANVTSLVLTPGDWDVRGWVNFTAASVTTAVGSLWEIGTSVTSATLPTDGSEVQLFQPALTTTTFEAGGSAMFRALSVTVATTVYLVAESTFTAGSVGAYGVLSARRLR